MDKKMLKEMFDNLLHIGNKTNYWNPKMKQYIYGSTNGVHIVNLLKTVNKVEDVKKQMEKLTGEGKKVLFVATKLQGRDSFKKLAEKTGNYYVCEKWIPGLLTNFKTIRKRIATYLKLLKDSEKGAFDVLTKKEKASKMLELSKLDKAFKGLKEMRKAPDIVFVVDGVYEKQALKEANILGLKTFAILNTNGNPDMVTDLIPANTNAVKSIEYVTSIIKDAFKVGVRPVRKSFIKKQEQRKISGIKKFTPKKPNLDDKKVQLKTQKVQLKTPEKKEVKEKTKVETKKEEK